MTVWAKTLAGALCLLAAGCGPLVDLPGQSAPPAYYRLSPPGDGDEERPLSETVVVLVETPSVPGELRGGDVAVKLSDSRVSFLDGVRWTDRTPDLLRRYMVAALRHGGGIKGIDGREDIDVQAPFRLRIDVESFYAYLGDRPRADVRLTATLLRNGPVTLIADKVFEVSEPAASERAEDLVAAFDKAMDRISGRMEVWLENRVARAGG